MGGDGCDGDGAYRDDGDAVGLGVEIVAGGAAGAGNGRGSLRRGCAFGRGDGFRVGRDGSRVEDRFGHPDGAERLRDSLSERSNVWGGSGYPKRNGGDMSLLFSRATAHLTGLLR